HEDVERDAEGARDLEADGHPAPRQREDADVGAVRVGAERAREPTPGVPAVAEARHAVSPVEAGGGPAGPSGTAKGAPVSRRSARATRARASGTLYAFRASGSAPASAAAAARSTSAGSGRPPRRRASAPPA